MRRRATDSDESDYRRERSMLRPLNGHVKWVVASVSAMGLTALVLLASSDRDRIDNAATAALAAAHSNEMRIAVIGTQLSQIQATLDEIKNAVREHERD